MQPARVLIIEARAAPLASCVAALAELDVQLVIARSAGEARQHVGAQEFAVILIDAHAIGEALESAGLLRREPGAERTPMIFFDVAPQELQGGQPSGLGAVDVVLAPLVPEVLQAKVRVFVELQQLLAREQLLRTEAEELSRLKDEFLATMSHELRTPLNAIFGWITLLRSGRLDEPTAARALETIERNARTQKRLIDDLLDVSRIVTGKVTLELSVIDPRRVIEAALETMQPAAEAKGVHLVAQLDAGVGVLRGDSARLQQVVCNLLSNAIKFTPIGGRVEVALQRRAGQAEITVGDNGQGIKAEFLPYVFDRFRQEDGSISRRHGGLGLGLAIVRHLVELHGGTVQAASAGEGRGATFSVRVPIRETPQPAAPVMPMARGPRLSGLHVLVVDDDPGARELIASILAGFGARVSLASSGPAALNLLFERRPHVLLADLAMPDMDGYALIEQVRALDPQLGGRVPAIAVTGYATAQDRLRALHAGFQNHIAKPVEPEELAAVITSVAGTVAPLSEGR